MYSGALELGKPLFCLAIDSLNLDEELVGNGPGEAGLEITLYGPELRFDGDLAIAITGADLGPRINDTKVDITI